MFDSEKRTVLRVPVGENSADLPLSGCVYRGSGEGMGTFELLGLCLRGDGLIFRVWDGLLLLPVEPSHPSSSSVIDHTIISLTQNQKVVREVGYLRLQLYDYVFPLFDFLGAGTCMF